MVPGGSDRHTHSERLSQIQIMMVTNIKEENLFTKIISARGYKHSSLLSGACRGWWGGEASGFLFVWGPLWLVRKQGSRISWRRFLRQWGPSDGSGWAAGTELPELRRVACLVRKRKLDCPDLLGLHSGGVKTFMYTTIYMRKSKTHSNIWLNFIQQVYHSYLVNGTLCWNNSNGSVK